MDNGVREKLRALIITQGRSVCDNPARCQSLLADICGDHQLELNLLVGALHTGVPARLQAAQAGVPMEMRCAQLASHLNKNHGLAEDGARWAVDSWALALGVIAAPAPDLKTVKDAAAPPKPGPAPPLKSNATASAKKPSAPPPITKPQVASVATSVSSSPRTVSPPKPAAGATAKTPAKAAAKPDHDPGWPVTILFLAWVIFGWQIWPYLATSVFGLKFDIQNDVWADGAIFVANAVLSVFLLGTFSSRKQ